MTFARLKELWAKVPKRPWHVETSNSWRRIGNEGVGNGNVLSPTVNRHDGHPDLAVSDETLDAIVVSANVMDALLAELEAARTAYGEFEPHGNVPFWRDEEWVSAPCDCMTCEKTNAYEAACKQTDEVMRCTTLPR